MVLILNGFFNNCHIYSRHIIKFNVNIDGWHSSDKQVQGYMATLYVEEKMVVADILSIYHNDTITTCRPNGSY